MLEEKALLRIEVGCPELLSSHELANILLALPNHFIKVLGGGQTILSVEECSSKELGEEINLITSQDMLDFLKRGI
jgi:hypothetical protein